jgi:hypothetical protein
MGERVWAGMEKRGQGHMVKDVQQGRGVCGGCRREGISTEQRRGKRRSTKGHREEDQEPT